MTELCIVKKSTVFKEQWQRLLTYKLSRLNEDEAIMIIRKHGEPINGILSAWHRVAKLKGFRPRTKTIEHELGHTVYLTVDKRG